MKIQHENYFRMLELFAALHEEVGEAQKAFNDLMWNQKGRNIDVATELADILPVLDEMQELVYAYMTCPTIPKNNPLNPDDNSSDSAEANIEGICPKCHQKICETMCCCDCKIYLNQ